MSLILSVCPCGLVLFGHRSSGGGRGNVSPNSVDGNTERDSEYTSYPNVRAMMVIRNPKNASSFRKPVRRERTINKLRKAESQF